MKELFFFFMKHVTLCQLDLHFMMVFCSLRCVWKGPGVEHQTCDIIGNTCIYPTASCQNGCSEKDQGMCCKSQQRANKMGEDDQTSSIHFPAFPNYICLDKNDLVWTKKLKWDQFKRWVSVHLGADCYALHGMKRLTTGFVRVIKGF